MKVKHGHRHSETAKRVAVMDAQLAAWAALTDWLAGRPGERLLEAHEDDEGHISLLVTDEKEVAIEGAYELDLARKLNLPFITPALMALIRAEVEYENEVVEQEEEKELDTQ